MLHINHRPKSFSEVIGHKEIIKSLESLFSEQDVPHAFLLSGSSGCGKTTIARIMANTLKAEIIEINIANTGGIDFVREMDEKARYFPLIGENKVFILDEVQQLTKEGQNALLKLLEDSPKHSYFILCTTDSNKLLLAIRNRCTSYTLKPLSDNEIKQLIKKVADVEQIDLSDDILDLIIYKANGVPRSGLVYLNQVKDIKSFEEATNLLADEITEEEDVINLCRLLIKNPKPQWIEVIDLFNKITIDPEQIRIVIAGYLAGCLKKKAFDKYVEMLGLFLSPLTFGSQKSELIYLLYKANKL